jgi:hypothetical protein
MFDANQKSSRGLLFSFFIASLPVPGQARPAKACLKNFA